MKITELQLRKIIREEIQKLNEARLKDIVPDIIFTAAKYTNQKLDHLARQSWDSSDELMKQIMQSWPLNTPKQRWTSFKRDVDKLLKKHSIREELNESKKIKGKDAGNYVKMAPKGRKITIKDKTYISLGKGNWKGPRGEKLNWIEISSKASALGNKNVQYEGFAGPLPKSEQGKFETSRKKSSEVLGYKLTGTPDRKTNIGLTEAKMVQYNIPESDKRMVIRN